MRFRLWFNVADFRPETVRVGFLVGACAVRVTAAPPIEPADVGDGNGNGDAVLWGRTVSVARRSGHRGAGCVPLIDRRSVRAVRTADGLLVVEGLTLTTTTTARPVVDSCRNAAAVVATTVSVRQLEAEAAVVGAVDVRGGNGDGVQEVADENKDQQQQQQQGVTSTGSDSRGGKHDGDDVRDVEKAIDRLKMEVCEFYHKIGC